MGVCTSSSQSNNQRQKKKQVEGKINQQISFVNDQKNDTTQFQEQTLKQNNISLQRKLSPNQITSQVQLSQTKNDTMIIRRPSHGTTMTTRTMIVQPSQLQEQQKTGSQLNLPYQRNSVRQNTKTPQVSVSKSYSIVSSKNLDNQGKTVMQHNETGQLVQVEILKFDNRNHQYIDKMGEIKLDNMHIVRIIDTLVDDNKKTYQVMYECCPGGSLSKFIEFRKFNHQQIGIILYQMVDALAYIHSLGLSHDELTIDSFSVFDDSSTPYIKLTDIRSIYQLMYPKEAHFYQDPLTITKSNLKHKATYHNNKQNLIETKTRNKYNDVWALAIIVLYLRNQELPYKISEIDQFDPQNYLNDHPSEMNSLLLEMLQINRYNRITLQKCLEHPYLIKMKQVQPQDFLKPLKNMIKCKNMTYFHKCVFQYLLHNYANDHLKVLTKLFLTADTNKDGTLSLDELKELFSIEGKDLIDELNLEKDLTLQEFLLLASNKEIILTQEILESSFKLLSRLSNIITPKSLQKVLNNCNEQQIRQDFKTFNLNEILSLKEYREFLNNYETPIPIA
ncbi:unnamed protein product [Paramecium sonneborni]|uniref:Protein kinase domain containing protein n=1 Tax=Paramecium sonneborni TaxID=65129 RepID=A0A8S1QVV3_9CILI|nr:unnamed protein product [Paramecium sonneborni]